MSNNDKDKNSEFNSKAYKHAIGVIESNNGKRQTNPSSSASGKYHFLYNLIKNDPDMKGVTKREFLNDDELQESIMDKAIAGNLSGYTYGSGVAQQLKNRYNTNHSNEDVAALVHLMGYGSAKEYLRNPKSYQTRGTNATPQEYLNRFQKAYNSYKEPEAPKYKAPTNNLREQRQPVQQDNTRVLQPVNKFNMGGRMEGMSGADKLVTLFKAGGSHADNPNGGIPQGIGANGKTNLVEEGETKWNDYIFSNEVKLDGSYAGSTSANKYKTGGKLKYETGGELDKKAPIVGPALDESSKYPMKLTKTQSMSHQTGEDIKVQDIRGNYINNNPLNTGTPLGEVDFDSAASDDSAKVFANRYNNPWARNTLLEQAGLTDYDVDNMVLRGLEAAKETGGNEKGSKASYDNKSKMINMGEDYAGDKAVETHERVHASGLDAAQGRNLMNILGNTFQQEGGMSNAYVGIKRYLNQPHEAYGNFVEFREKLGLKPGEQLTEEELRKRAKAKGLSMENFYRAFDKSKITEALNTIAYQGRQDNANNLA